MRHPLTSAMQASVAGQPRCRHRTSNSPTYTSLPVQELDTSLVMTHCVAAVSCQLGVDTNGSQTHLCFLSSARKQARYGSWQTINALATKQTAIFKQRSAEYEVWLRSSVLPSRKAANRRLSADLSTLERHTRLSQCSLRPCDRSPASQRSLKSGRCRLPPPTL